MKLLKAAKLSTFAVTIAFITFKLANFSGHVLKRLVGQQRNLSPAVIALALKQQNATVKWKMETETRREQGIDTESRRFMVAGHPIDRWQFPLLPDLASSDTSVEAYDPHLPQFELQDGALLAGDRFAYVWYATSSDYLCSALIAASRLRNLRRKAGDSSPFHSLHVDYLMIHVEEDFPDDKKRIDIWTRDGGKKYVQHNAYYEKCLQKLYAFQLTDYARVVFMDADGVPMANLDHLFALKFPSGVHIAAPPAYWEDNSGVVKGGPDECTGVPFVIVTSSLVVIEPSLELYQRVSSRFGSVRTHADRENYDMDILNLEFACTDQVLVLPKQYCTLNSDFHPGDRVYNPDINFEEIQYLHFSANGKPWMTAKELYMDNMKRPEYSRLMDLYYNKTATVC